MPFSNYLVALILAFALTGCVGVRAPSDQEALRSEVTRTELAFADSMAKRDFTTFASFVAEEAIFLNGGKPLRGKQKVLEHWKHYFEGPAAPFSWKPDLVEVLPSGKLAESIGPVFSPDGKLVARFYSTWRKEPTGAWRIVFDNGYAVSGTPASP